MVSLRYLRFLSLVLPLRAQVLTLSGTNSPSGSSIARGPDGVPTGSEVTYISYSSTITAATSNTLGSFALETGTTDVASSTFAAANSSETTSKSTSSDSVTLLSGGSRSSSTHLNGTVSSANATRTSSSSTSSLPPPVNTQPCNNYVEFCERSYSNITYVAAHNAPFVRSGNAGANQDLPLLDQLNDGIRMLQFQVHDINGTLYLCHTDCDLLNVGRLEDYFEAVRQWIDRHPYDVITILIGNSDLVAPTDFAAPVMRSGLISYVYQPPKIPMSLDDWPKLSSMILKGRQAVLFMDYNANQTAVPYILDEFSQLWETPFSPQNRSFPCTVERPPNLPPEAARNRMYMANHNLNQEISLLGNDLLVPNTVLLNETNGVSGYGSLGAMADDCTERWNRPPNFLLVDFYNYGSSNGSVFEVAAEMNNVTYNRSCCGLPQSSASTSTVSRPSLIFQILVTAAVGMLW